MPTKILYVEDEVFLGKIVAESLESRGYEVVWHKDGAEVLKSIQSFHPDVCVLDIMLPNVDGYELARRLRKEYTSVPILFLTARDQTEDVLKGFSSGGNDYIRKPFSVEELIVRIENLLSVMRSGGAMGEQVRIGKFTFSPASMELMTDTESFRLSHRESELLKVLLQHQNLPVERRFILKAIWGDDSFFNSRNLDVYITRLRKYFREDPALEIITLKGVGYQFLVR